MKQINDDIQCDEWYDEIENQTHCEPHELIQRPDGILMCQLCGLELTIADYQMFKEPYITVDEPTTKGIHD